MKLTKAQTRCINVVQGVVTPALQRLGNYGPTDATLVGCIGYAESKYDRTIQTGRGPALSWWQIEPRTCGFVLSNLLEHHNQAYGNLMSLIVQHHDPGRFLDPAGLLHTCPMYAAAICRGFFLHVPEPLPDFEDLEAIARYWKKYYNTPAGAGTVDGFCQQVRPVFKHIKDAAWEVR